MNLNCPICAELFLPSDDVYCTTCGHMFHHQCLLQWLERSKTCPQCRNKCSQKSIIKVYFNQANLDTSRIDVGSLQEQLDNANLKIKMKDMESSKAEKEISSLKEIQKKFRGKSGFKQHAVTAYAQQMQVLKHEIKVVESLRSENKSLKEQLKFLENVNEMITANQVEIERLVSQATDIRALGTCVISLKKELKNADNKKTELRNMVKALQHEARKASDVQKMLDDKIATLESENFHLKEKRDKLKQIEESTSPYLNIKSTLNFRQQDKKGSGISIEGRPKLSILSKNKPLLTRKVSSSNLVFNGLGGSSKPSENEFPNSDLFTAVKKTTSNPSSLSNRLKAGRLRKLPSSSDLA
uniref:RING-type domain-containing protein n=1 Tax=Megaselia scalaris TaxID=36166 RepID=T1GW77_MEGSC